MQRPASSGIAQSTMIEFSVSTICENAGRKSGLAYYRVSVFGDGVGLA